MTGSDLCQRMREDWNRRAREDAAYYVAFGRREQSEEEFLATGRELALGLAREIKRLKPLPYGRGSETQAGSGIAGWRALEIGCGLGRLMRPLAPYFAEIHGVDVSDEMIRRAEDKLRDVPNARLLLSSGADLAMLPDESFHFVYSYAVFQHIPSREVVLRYLAEARRVMATGGIFRFQVNGLPETAARYDTWNGVRISACRGRFACISLWLEGLPEDCDLNHLEVTIAGAPGQPEYLGPPQADGLQQLNVRLPASVPSGLQPLEISWLGRAIAPRATVRVIPPGPLVPRIVSVTDGIDLLSGTRIVSRSVKVGLEEVATPSQLRAAVDGAAIEGFEFFCVDPAPPRFEVNFTLPPSIGPGPHELELSLGARRFPPIAIEVA